MIRITQEERKAQKRLSQRLHRTLNARGIVAQLKGDVNEAGDAVIQLPAGVWLFVRCEGTASDGIVWSFLLSSDRTGYDYFALSEDEEDMLNHIPKVLRDIATLDSIADMLKVQGVSV